MCIQLHKIIYRVRDVGWNESHDADRQVRVLSTVRASVHLCWHVIICTRRIHVPSTVVAVDTFRLGRETFNKTLRDTPYLSAQKRVRRRGNFMSDSQPLKLSLLNFFQSNKRSPVKRNDAFCRWASRRYVGFDFIPKFCCDLKMSFLSNYAFWFTFRRTPSRMLANKPVTFILFTSDAKTRRG